MRRPLPLLLVAAALAAVITPPVGAAPAGLPLDVSGWATPNVTPRAHELTRGGGVGGAFYGKDTYVLSAADEIWNYTNVPMTFTGRETGTGGLEVFDVSTPEAPKRKAFLSLPNFQNEDIQVSTRRKIAVMSQDGVGRITLVDLTDTSSPKVLSELTLPVYYGHTSTLVDDDRYLWVSGEEDVLVVDIRDLAKPVVAGTFATPAGKRGPSGYSRVHDASVDRFGDITVYGGGGTAVYRLTSNPLKPALVAVTAKKDLTAERDGLTHHGGMRLDKDTWLITEEDYSSGCDKDGSLQVWRIDRPAKALRFVSSWDAPVGADADRGALAQDYCSSHWFDLNDNHVVADGWYRAGVRFLDLSDPKHPRPIGSWVGDSATASQALFFPGRNDLVYVADYARGLDVVSLANGGRKARTTSLADEKRVGSSAPGLTLKVKLVPHHQWGWSCLTPAATPQQRAR